MNELKPLPILRRGSRGNRVFSKEKCAGLDYGINGDRRSGSSGNGRNFFTVYDG